MQRPDSGPGRPDDAEFWPSAPSTAIPIADSVTDTENLAWYARRWLPLTVQYHGPLIEQLWLTPGNQLLDVACGPGALVAETAELVGPFGRIVGLDRSPAMLHAAMRLARRKDLMNAAFARGDMPALPFATASFDAVTCAFALANLDVPGAALLEMRRVLRSGGHLGIIVLGPAGSSPGAGLLLHALAQRALASGHEAGFAAGTPGAVERWLTDAGLTQVRSVRLARELRRIDFDDVWADVLAGQMPGTPIYRALPAQIRAAVREDVRTAVQALRSGSRLLLPVEALVASGVA